MASGVSLLFLTFLDLTQIVLSLFAYALIFMIILDWLVYFGIITRHQSFVAKVMYVLHRLTDPVLKPIRRFMPDLGGIDISPIAVFILIHVINNLLFRIALRLGG